jgi:hypothetical protein
MAWSASAVVGYLPTTGHVPPYGHPSCAHTRRDGGGGGGCGSGGGGLHLEQGVASRHQLPEHVKLILQAHFLALEDPAVPSSEQSLSALYGRKQGRELTIIQSGFLGEAL